MQGTEAGKHGSRTGVLPFVAHVICWAFSIFDSSGAFCCLPPSVRPYRRICDPHHRFRRCSHSSKSPPPAPYLHHASSWCVCLQTRCDSDWRCLSPRPRLFARQRETVVIAAARTATQRAALTDATGLCSIFLQGPHGPHFISRVRTYRRTFHSCHSPKAWAPRLFRTVDSFSPCLARTHARSR